MVKRASPGAEEQKTLTANLTEQDAAKLTDIRREIAKLDLYMGACHLLDVISGIWNAYSALERLTAPKYVPSYERRREITKAISNFWPVALMHHDVILIHVQHSSDQTALTYLEDVWVTRDPKEHRAFTIEFVGGTLLGFWGLLY
jgi:template-activating factor I